MNDGFKFWDVDLTFTVKVRASTEIFAETEEEARKLADELEIDDSIYVWKHEWNTVKNVEITEIGFGGYDDGN